MHATKVEWPNGGESMSVQNALTHLLVAAFAISVGTVSAAEQSAASPSGYDKPPANILEVMHAPSPPVPDVSPTHDAMVLISWQDYPSIARVATPYLRLAG